MKIAISGKGGVGKTTLSAMLAASWGLKGHRVIAVDADPDANLAAAFGLSPADGPTYLSEMRGLIAERTGATKDYGGYFRLNPKVDDIPDTYSRRIGPVRLLALGGVRKGGEGCLCPATALIKALLTHLVLGSDDALVMDMDAGVEHLGRATTQSMDRLIVVVDDGPWSLQTAHRVRCLAADIGMTDVAAVINRVRESTDLASIRRSLRDIPVLGTIPADDRLRGGIVSEVDEHDLKPTDALRELLPRLDAILAALQAGASQNHLAGGS